MRAALDGSPLWQGRCTQPAGPAHLSRHRPDRRRHPRRASLRGRAARDRAERTPREPARARRGGPRGVGRLLRRAAARPGARPDAHRPRAGAHRGQRAHDEAAAGAAVRAAGWALGPRGPAGRRTRRDLVVSARAHRRGTAAGGAGLLRAGDDHARGGDRRPHHPGAAGRAAPRRAGLPRPAHRRDLAAVLDAGARPATATGARRGERRGASAGARADPLPGTRHALPVGPRAARGAGGIRARWRRCWPPPASTGKTEGRCAPPASAAPNRPLRGGQGAVRLGGRPSAEKLAQQRLADV